MRLFVFFLIAAVLFQKGHFCTELAFPWAGHGCFWPELSWMLDNVDAGVQKYIDDVPLGFAFRQGIRDHISIINPPDGLNSFCI